MKKKIQGISFQNLLHIWFVAHVFYRGVAVWMGSEYLFHKEN